jgi:hypothetical protein
METRRVCGPCGEHSVSVELQENTPYRVFQTWERPTRLRLEQVCMASWMVSCKNCGNAFAFASIGDSLSDFYFPQKPEFPPRGLERECPHCAAKFNYEKHELTYKD